MSEDERSHSNKARNQIGSHIVYKVRGSHTSALLAVRTLRGERIFSVFIINLLVITF